MDGYDDQGQRASSVIRVLLDSSSVRAPSTASTITGACGSTISIRAWAPRSGTSRRPASRLIRISIQSAPACRSAFRVGLEAKFTQAMVAPPEYGARPFRIYKSSEWPSLIRVPPSRRRGAWESSVVLRSGVRAGCRDVDGATLHGSAAGDVRPANSACRPACAASQPGIGPRVGGDCRRPGSTSRLRMPPRWPGGGDGGHRNQRVGTSPEASGRTIIAVS